MTGFLARAGMAIALASLAPSSLAQTPSDAPIIASMSVEAQAAASVADAFHAALGRNDAKAALALMADEAVIFEGGHVERSKKEYASQHAGADAAFASAVPPKLIRRSGSADADTAWVLSETRTTGRYKDKPVDRLSIETMLLKKTSDGWRITHIHWSSRAAT